MEFLANDTPHVAGWPFPYPILLRLPLAAALVAWGARTNRRWVVPAAALLAMPRLYFQSPALSWRSCRPFGRVGQRRTLGPERATPDVTTDATPMTATVEPARPASRVDRRVIGLLWAGLAAAILVRLLVMPNYILLGDLHQYARWAYHLATDLPFGAAYRQDFSYMPVLVAVFGTLGRLVPAFLTAGDASDAAVRVVLKVPALLGELAIVAGLFTVLRQRPPLAIAAILAVLLVPAGWYLSAWWGQLDLSSLRSACGRRSSPHATAGGPSPSSSGWR